MYSTHSPQNDRTDTYLKYTDAKILKHRPYNPDLNLADRFLFTRVQENCKRLKVFLRRLSEYTLKNELLLLLEQYEQDWILCTLLVNNIVKVFVYDVLT